MKIVEKLIFANSKKLLAPILFLLVFLKWLFKSAPGILTLSMIAYSASPFLFNIEPLRFKDFISLVEASSEERKIAIFTSIITLAGFVVAFWQASLIWKNQKKTEITVQAVDEISEFFSEFWGLSLKIQLHAESFVNLHKIIAGDLVELSEAHSEAKFLIGRTDKFVESRNKLSEMAIRVHALRSKHYLILAESWFKLKSFEGCEKSLTRISELMWFYCPISAENSTQYLRMMTTDDAEKALRAAHQIEQEIQNGSSLSGAIRGSMLGNFFTPSIFLILDFTRILKVLGSKKLKHARRRSHSTKNQEKSRKPDHPLS